MTRAVWIVILLTLVVAGGAGCNDGAADPPCTCAEGRMVDDALMAFLSKARSAHHQADAREEAEDLDGAIAALERITGTPLDDSMARPETGEVIADTRARLADLRSQLGNHDAAEREIARGLKLAPKDSYFEGHLYEVRGVNEERRANALAEEGNTDAAEKARRRAFASFESAIDIQDRVIRRALGDAGAAP